MSTNSAAQDDFPLDELTAHAAWLRRLALRLVRDAATADDLVQEAWLAALERPPATDRPLRPWLGGVLRNLVKRRARTEHRRTRREERVAELREPLPTPDELAERLELQRELSQAVAELDEPFRSTLQLRYDEGLSAAEIARREGLPAGTVRWRLKTALDRVRDRLDRGHGGDRRAWVLLWIPVVARDATPLPGASGGGSSATAQTGGLSALISGVLAMTLSWKLPVVICVVAAAAAGVGWLSQQALSLDPAPQQAELVEFEPQRERVPRNAARVDEATVETDDDTSSATAAPSETAAFRARVRGRVVDPSGAPVAGASVDFGELPSRTTTESGSTGTFEMELEFPDTDWTIDVSATAVGHAAASARVRLKSDAEIVVPDLVLPAGGAVRGLIRDENGLPLADALVELGDPGWVGLGYDRERRQRSNFGGDRRGVRTDDAGMFELDGVPVGTQRLWARADDHLATVSGPIEVRKGMVSTGIVIELPALGPKDRVSGQVLLPDGTPAAYADLTYRYDDGFMGSGSGSMRVDAEGRFERVVTASSVYGFSAVDRDEVFGAVMVEDVAAGTTDLVLRLVEPQFVQVVVRDDAGPVAQFDLTITDVEQVTLHGYLRSDEVSADGVRVKVPGGPFMIRVQGDHHGRAEVGPLYPDELPNRLTVELESLPGVRGRVLAGDAAVSGAHVELLAETGTEQRVVHNGFETRWKPQPTTSTRSDKDGAFRLTVREAGRYLIRVRAEGFAPSYLGPVDLDPKHGTDGLDASLTTGATLEGRVGPGQVVGVSRGDGLVRTVRAGADGVYRFDHLTPGGYQARVVDEEVVPGNSSTETFRLLPGQRRPLAFDVQLNDGESRGLDLGSAAPGTTIVGRLDVVGGEVLGWTAKVLPESWADRTADADTTALAGDGTFRVALPDGDGVRLLLQAPGGRVSLFREIPADERPDVLHFQVQLTTAEVTGAPDPRQARDRGIPALLQHHADGTLALTALITTDDGDFHLDAVPAGTHDLVLIPQDAANLDPHELPVVDTIEVAPDGSTTIDLTPHYGDR